MSYLDKALERAKRRKSTWNLLLLPAVVVPLGLMWWLSVVGIAKLYRVVHPQTDFVLLPDTVGGILIAIGPFFAWLAPAMIIGNFATFMVPAARRALEAEAATVRGGDFRSANRGLLKGTAILMPAGILVTLLGVWLPWCPQVS